MQLEKVTVNFQRKKNLGNYESADASCMLTAYVEPGDNKDAVMQGLWQMAKENVKAALAQYYQNITVEELFLGLPKEVQESQELRQIRELIITTKEDY